MSRERGTEGHVPPAAPDERASRGDTKASAGEPATAKDAADGCIGCGLCGRHIVTIKMRRPVSRDSSAPPDDLPR
jgi:hypothetical protein